jgi:hypothetical protein
MVQKSTSSSCRLALHTIALRDQTRSNSSLHLSSRFVSSRPRYCGKLQPSPRLPFLLATPDSLFYSLAPPHSVALSSQYSSISFHSMQKYSNQHTWSFKSIGRFIRHRGLHTCVCVSMPPFLVCSYGDIGTHGRHVLRAPRAMDPEIARPSSQAKAFISIIPRPDTCIYRGNPTLLDDPDCPRRP